MISVDNSPFKKRALFDRLSKLFNRNEEIVAPVHFAFARRTSRKRDRIAKIRHGFQHAANERAFAATRRRADNDEHSAPRSQLFKSLAPFFRFTQHSELARAAFRLR